jgi:hypothetical protein
MYAALHKDGMMKNLEVIQTNIMNVRGMNVMLDKDLAVLYGVQTKILVQAVKRNQNRFPPDFMFCLTHQEVENLRSQSVTSSWGGRRYLPRAFTEQGVAMLSGILNSRRAVAVNIRIMRTFVQMRKYALTYGELARKIESLERKYDGQFDVVFEALKRLMAPPAPPRRRIGFTG